MLTELRDEQAGLRTGALIILAIVAVAAALYFTRLVTIPFVLSVFVYCAFSPLLDRLEGRLGLPHALAVALTLLAVLGLVTLVGAMCVISVQVMIQTADEYRAEFIDVARQCFEYLDDQGIDVNGQPVVSAMRQVSLAAVGIAAGTVLDLLAGMVMIVVFVVFLLAGRNPRSRRSEFTAEIDGKIRRYIVAKFLASAAVGLVVWMILELLNLRLAGLFAFLAFLLNFVPQVGGVMATLLPAPMAFAQFGWGWETAAVILLPGAVEILVGNFIEPKIYGKGLDLHPVTIVLALAFWGILWGIAGMVLAAPLTAAVQIVFQRFETTRPVAELLAGRRTIADLAERPAADGANS